MSWAAPFASGWRAGDPSSKSQHSEGRFNSQWLLRQVADTSDKPYSVAPDAVWSHAQHGPDDGPMCLDLVARGGDVNYQDAQFDQSTALIVAVNTGHVEIVRALCDSEGVRLDEKDGLLGRTALCRAAYVGNVEMVRLLIEAGAGLDVLDMDENSAFVYAEENAHPEVSALLDEAGALFIYFGKLRRKESWG